MSSGYVTDTTYLGCAAAPGQAGSSAGALSVILLAGLLLRRRARSQA